MPVELPEREEIEEKYKWDTGDIYKSLAEWENDYKNVLEKINDIQGLKDKLTLSGENLLEGIEYILNINKKVDKIYTYAHLRHDENTGDQNFQGLLSRAQNLMVKINNATSYMIPEILSMTDDKLLGFIENTPGLELYKKMLENIMRRKEHYLSDKEERIIALAGDMARIPDNVFAMLNDADIEFPLIKDEKGNNIRLTHGRFIKYMQSKDRDVRKKTFNVFYKEYEKLENTFAKNLESAVKTNIFYKNVRNYKSSLAAALDENNIPLSIYDNLIKTVKDNHKNFYRYINLRKDMLNLEEIHIYDLYVPLVQDIDYNIEFDEARKTVIKGLAPLGSDYINIIKKGFNSSWIDVYENKGKRSGAYSSGCYGVHPYVLLNYNKSLDNMFTVAHEMGHALHSYYTNKNQPYVYANYSIFVAEVASTLNEILLINYMLKKNEDKLMKKYLLNYLLEQYRKTVFRQTMFAEFEKIIHKRVEDGQPLTCDYLKKVYYNLNKEYYGPNIVIDKKIELEWARIPHFYYNFYVYQYATGFSAAAALAKSILNKGETAKDKYIDFLKRGNSDYPVNLLKDAGVDLTKTEPIEEAMTIFNKYLQELENMI